MDLFTNMASWRTIHPGVRYSNASPLPEKSFSLYGKTPSHNVLKTLNNLSSIIIEKEAMSTKKAIEVS
jgi:hypothetical protein